MTVITESGAPHDIALHSFARLLVEDAEQDELRATYGRHWLIQSRRAAGLPDERTPEEQAVWDESHARHKWRIVGYRHRPPEPGPAAQSHHAAVQAQHWPRKQRQCQVKPVRVTPGFPKAHPGRHPNVRMVFGVSDEELARRRAGPRPYRKPKPWQTWSPPAINKLPRPGPAVAEVPEFEGRVAYPYKLKYATVIRLVRLTDTWSANHDTGWLRAVRDRVTSQAEVVDIVFWDGPARTSMHL